MWAARKTRRREPVDSSVCASIGLLLQKTANDQSLRVFVTGCRSSDQHVTDRFIVACTMTQMKRRFAGVHFAGPSPTEVRQWTELSVVFDRLNQFNELSIERFVAQISDRTRLRLQCVGGPRSGSPLTTMTARARAALRSPGIHDGHGARLRPFCLRKPGKLFDLTK